MRYRREHIPERVHSQSRVMWQKDNGWSEACWFLWYGCILILTFLYVQNKREVISNIFAAPIRVCQNFRTYKCNLTLDCVEDIITIVFDRCMVYVNLLFNFFLFPLLSIFFHNYLESCFITQFWFSVPSIYNYISACIWQCFVKTFAVLKASGVWQIYWMHPLASVRQKMTVPEIMIQCVAATGEPT